MGFTLKATGSLDRMMARAQALATGRMGRTVAPRIAASELRGLAETGKATHTNPSGRAWKRTKSGAELKWPNKTTLTVKVVGGKIVAQLSGPPYLAAQHAGWRRFSSKDGVTKRWKGPPRRILPKSAVPKRWAEPIVKALNIGWREFMGSTSIRRARVRK